MAALHEAEAALGAWSIQPYGSLEEIKPGRVFKVRQEGGSDLILKDVGEHPSKRLLFECDILRHLAAAGLPVAVPLKTAQGQHVVDVQRARFTLSPCLTKDGDPEPVGWEERMPAYGEAMARLHLALATYPEEGLAERTWRNDPLQESYELYLPNLLLSLSADQAALLSTKVHSIAAEMRSALEELPVQLVHRDLHDNHILFSGKRVVGIIECDHVSIGSPMIDVAYFLHHSVKWLKEADGTMVHNEGGTNWWLSWVPNLIRAYHRIRPLSAKERASLPYMMIWVMLMFANWFDKRGNYEETQLYLNLFDFVYVNRHEIERRVGAV